MNLVDIYMTQRHHKRVIKTGNLKRALDSMGRPSPLPDIDIDFRENREDVMNVMRQMFSGLGLPSEMMSVLRSNASILSILNLDNDNDPAGED